MKIFVTGGTGFIGRRVIPVLAVRGHEIMVLVQKGKVGFFKEYEAVTCVNGDLKKMGSVAKAMRSFDPDSLVHLAWDGLPDYSERMCFHNFELSFNLFMMAAGIVRQSILSTGSCWEYASRNGKQSEESSLGTSGTTFPAVKNALRFLGEAVATGKGLSFYWLRLFFVYGPGQRRQSLIPSIIDSVLKGETPSIKTPENVNDFIYVEDVARAIADVLERMPKNTVYNIGTGQPVSVKDVVSATFAAAGKLVDESFFKGKQEEPVQNFWGDISRIRDDVGWEPEVDIKAGIKKTLKLSRKEKK